MLFLRFWDWNTSPKDKVGYMVKYFFRLKRWKIMCCIVLGDFFLAFVPEKLTHHREMVVTNNLGMNAQHFCDHKTPWLMGFTTKTAKGLTLGWSQQYFSHILEVLGPREQGRSGLDCVKILVRRVQNNHRVKLNMIWIKNSLTKVGTFCKGHKDPYLPTLPSI